MALKVLETRRTPGRQEDGVKATMQWSTSGGRVSILGWIERRKLCKERNEGKEREARKKGDIWGCDILHVGLALRFQLLLSSICIMQFWSRAICELQRESRKDYVRYLTRGAQSMGLIIRTMRQQGNQCCN